MNSSSTIQTDNQTASNSLHEHGKRKNESNWGVRIALIIPALFCLGAIFADISPQAVALAVLGLMLVLIVIKVPVGVAMAVPAVLGLFSLHGWTSVGNALGSLPFDSTAQWTLSVLPMFVFMGILLQNSGIANDLYLAATRWLHWLPGNIAVATNVAGAGIASISGSSMATTYTLGRVGIPAMLDKGYDRRLAVGAVGAASLPGNLIPPSILLIVYAGIAQVPIGPQLMAGLLPGIVIILASCGLIIILATMKPSLVGGNKDGNKEEAPTWVERWKSLARIWPLPILVVVVLGLIFTGIFTVTEAAAAGALGALALTMWILRGKDSVRTVSRSAVDTIETIGGIFLLIIGANLINRVLAVSGLTADFVDWVMASDLNRIQFILVVLLAYVIMGMFLDAITMMLLTVPLLLPILGVMGIDPLWFGVFVVLLAELGMLTPPVGILSFIVYAMTQKPEVNRGVRITLADVFIAMMWFLPAIALTVATLIIFPEIATWLPSFMAE